MGSKTIKSFKENFHVLYSLAKYLNVESIVIEKKGFKDLTGLIFVITGDVYTFQNRNELKKLIGDLGGKLTGSVSKKTNYLITNDSDTNTVKNKRAIELGVKIITEEDFNQLIGR
jgi:DNA ligase (NAD+)